MTGTCYFCGKEGNIEKMYVLSSQLFIPKDYLGRTGTAEFDDYILCFDCSLKIKRMKKKKNI